MVGDLDLSAPMEFPEGKYSTKDTLGEIAKCPEAFAVTANALKPGSNFKLEPSSSK